jgi:diguanylate cyclase (GGDEF)-like protein
MVNININSIIILIFVVLAGLAFVYWRFRKKITKLKNLAYSDDLGIFNHREINRQINRLIKNNNDHSFAFILLDIDRFKNYNDHFGYDKADQVLQEFVNITKGFIRKSDIFFRYKNGDEFALIFNEVEMEEAKEIANRLRRVIAYHPFKIDNNEVNLTISMGITSNFKNDNAEKIRKRAEVALMEAKQSKNTVVLIEAEQKKADLVY